MTTWIISILVLGALSFATQATADEICWSSGGTQFVNAIHFCVSSVLKPEGSRTYGPRNLADGNQDTAWCEGTDGHGVGETITIRVSNGPAFRRLLVRNGYGRTQRTFRENGRVKTLEISLARGIRTTVDLIDQNGILPIYLPVLAKDTLTLKIIDVYPGEKFADTCLGFLHPDFEHEEELLQRQQRD